MPIQVTSIDSPAQRSMSSPHRIYGWRRSRQRACRSSGCTREGARRCLCVTSVRWTALVPRASFLEARLVKCNLRLGRPHRTLTAFVRSCSTSSSAARGRYRLPRTNDPMASALFLTSTLTLKLGGARPSASAPSAPQPVIALNLPHPNELYRISER